MKINRIFKTIFLYEFILAIVKAIKEILKQRKLLTIHLKKVQLVQDLEASMH